MSLRLHLDSDDERNGHEPDHDFNSYNVLRVSNRPRSPQPPPLSPEEQMQRYSLSDGEILALLPGSESCRGNAEAVTKCRECDRQSTRQTCGYCVHHFCVEYRLGNVEIPPAVTNALQNTRGRLFSESSPDEMVAGTSIQRNTSSDSSPPQERGTASRRREGREYSEHDYEHQNQSRRRTEERRNNRGSKETHGTSSSSDESSKRPKVCAAPMCTKKADENNLCRTCHDKLSRTKPKRRQDKKYPCAYKYCKWRTLVKGGLCKECEQILQDENASGIRMPEPANPGFRNNSRHGPDHAIGITAVRNHGSTGYRASHIEGGQRQGNGYQCVASGQEHQGARPRITPHERHQYTRGPEEGAFNRQPHCYGQHGYSIPNSDHRQAEQSHHYRHQRRQRVNDDYLREEHHRQAQQRFNPWVMSNPEHSVPLNDESGPSSILSDTCSYQQGVNGWRETSPIRSHCKRPRCEFYGDMKYNGFCSVCFRRQN